MGYYPHDLYFYMYKFYLHSYNNCAGGQWSFTTLRLKKKKGLSRETYKYIINTRLFLSFTPFTHVNPVIIIIARNYVQQTFIQSYLLFNFNNMV